MGGPFDSDASSPSSGATRPGAAGDGTRGPGPSSSPGAGATRPGAYGDGTRGGGSSDSGGGASRPSPWRNWRFGVPYRPSAAGGSAGGGGGQTPSAGAPTGPGAFTGAGHDRSAPKPAAPSKPRTGAAPTVGGAGDGGASRSAPRPPPGPARSGAGASGKVTGQGAGDVARARKIRNEAAAEHRAADSAGDSAAADRSPTGPRPGAAPSPSASATAAKAPSAGAKPAPAATPLGDEDLGELQRTADAMKRTTDIAGFADTVDGAVEIDPQAAAREIGALRELIAGAGLEDQLDGMLHDAMLKHVATGAPRADQGDLIPAPAGEPSTLEGGAGQDPIVDQGQATPSAASFQGKEGDGRVTDPVALSEAQRQGRSPAPTQGADPAGEGGRAPAADIDAWSIQDPYGDGRFIVDENGDLLRDSAGEPVKQALQPGDPRPTAADVAAGEAAHALIDEIMGQSPEGGIALERRLRDIEETHGEGSALTLALWEVAAKRSQGLNKNTKEELALAVEKARALADDKTVPAAMRANRDAYEQISPEDRSAAAEERFRIEKEMRTLMDEAQQAQAALHSTSRSEVRRSYGPDNPSPSSKAAYEKKLAELAERFEALYAKEAALPGLSHPEVDPGLAKEFGHNAPEMLEARAQAVNLLISAGLAVTPVGVARTAVGVVGKAAAKGLGQGTGLAAGAAGAGLAGKEAMRQAYRTEIEALGLDPNDPNALQKLPPEARERIGIKGAIGLLANGASTVMAREVIKALTGPSVSELQKAAAEETLKILITPPSDR